MVKYLVFLFLNLILLGTAQARVATYSLNFGDQIYDERVAPVLLKRVLQQQYPWLDSRGLRLLSIDVVAKSRGQGQVNLYMDRYVVDRQFVPGDPRYFESNDPRTYYTIRLNNNNGNGQEW